MAGAHTLTDPEISIMKAMLRLFPRLSNQAILAYFTRPGRDLNHRLVAEIASGRWAWVPSASPAEALAFMAAFTFIPYPSADAIIHGQNAVSRNSTAIAGLDLHWWPVGQGLFHSGRLRTSAGSSFSWVYDCGSSSGSAVRDAAIRAYRHGSQGRIDLVTLSHFDADHINGIVALLAGTTVRTLLLPYLPLWQRLMIAFETGIAESDPLFGFFVDPVAFLSGIDGGAIGQILFVPPAGPDDIAPGAPGEAPPAPEGLIDDAKIDDGPPPPDADGDPAANGRPGIQVRFLWPGGRISIASLWEFVPYNDATLRPKATPLFERRAACLARNFARKPTRRAAALKLLKRLYDKIFGAGPRPRNLASLFLYSGPVGTRISLAHFWASAAVRFNSAEDNFAQLSTGDGYVHTAAQLAALKRFYSHDRRFERAGIVQVMHHDARGNWQEGVALEMKPAVSIFSSDPDHGNLKHPHAEVLRDFWPWCPVQVDMDDSFHLLATLAVEGL